MQKIVWIYRPHTQTHIPADSDTPSSDFMSLWGALLHTTLRATEVEKERETDGVKRKNIKNWSASLKWGNEVSADACAFVCPERVFKWRAMGGDGFRGCLNSRGLKKLFHHNQEQKTQREQTQTSAVNHRKNRAPAFKPNKPQNQALWNKLGLFSNFWSGLGSWPPFLTLGMMSFSFLRTKRPSLSSLFQFSCTTSGFSSKSSFLSSVTEKDYASQKFTSLWTLIKVQDMKIRLQSLWVSLMKQKH